MITSCQQPAEFDALQLRYHTLVSTDGEIPECPWPVEDASLRADKKDLSVNIYAAKLSQVDTVFVQQGAEKYMQFLTATMTA